MITLKEELLKAFKDKKVIVTGHTGFKGSWLCEWLLLLQAKVIGISLSPKSKQSLFNKINLKSRIKHNIIDIRNHKIIRECILDEKPDYIFHLAAQPLVRDSYIDPIETYSTNFMGTVYILDTLREVQKLYKSINKNCATVFVTTDKCYDNKEWLNSYREDDPLGGFDPYSSSKGAAEIAIASYRNSYFNTENDNVGISSARAGNVIGGGDWSKDRLIPDCIKFIKNKQTIEIRYPNATRPWQHVLDALGGYLLLASKQYNAVEQKDLNQIKLLCSAYNFGPNIKSNKSVKNLVTKILSLWPGEWIDISDTDHPYESSHLNLSWDKSFHNLGWHPNWDFEETLFRTINWYKLEHIKKLNARELVHLDIYDYLSNKNKVL